MKKKGRINLLSFEGDEGEITEIDFHNKQIKEKDPKRSFINKNERKTEVDFSQIRDRVIQMDFNEEIILEGDSVEAFLKNNFNENDLSSEEGEELKLAERIKEAKLKRSLKDISQYQYRDQDQDNEKDQDQELPDYIPITTKGEYWLNRDTRESEETFNSTTSRLVREDLFNEMEINDGHEGFTQFFGKDVAGRRGMMMTSKILERDIKSELYDMELDVTSVNDLELNDEISDVMWEQSQVLKGIEKGWNHLEGDGNNNNFLSIQAKLSTSFIPPKPLNLNPLNNDTFDLKINDEELKKLEENVDKIAVDSRKFEERINELKLEIENSEIFIKRSSEIETFFMRYSRFLSEKIPKLQSLELEFGGLTLTSISDDLTVNDVNVNTDSWESFFDDVDVEDSDLLDLPEIIKKYKAIIKTNLEQKYLIELTGLFVRYHFLPITTINDNRNIWTIYEESGLSAALKLLNTEQQSNADLKLLDAIFEEIEIENGNGNEPNLNLNRIKGIRDEILIKINK